MKETWKRVPGYKKYFVSDRGRVKSFAEDDKGVYLSNAKGKDGYVRIRMFSDTGYRRTWKVHRLVCFVFKGESDLQINHINGIKNDNRIENLEYCTASHNLKHAYALGLASNKGERHPRAKLSDEEILIIRKLHNDNNIGKKIIGILFDTSRRNVSRIVNNKSWSHVTES